MKTHTPKSIPLFLALALGLLPLPAALAQSAPMKQGDHQIIIQETKKVLEQVTQLKEQNKTFQDKFQAEAKREAALRGELSSPDLSQEKRRDVEAHGLEAQANLVLMIHGQMVDSIAKYQQISSGLDRIIDAAAHGAMFDDKAKQAQARLTATLDEAYDRDSELYGLVGRQISKGDIPLNVADSYRSSRQRMLAALQAVRQLNGSFDNKRFGQQMHDLRAQVQQRLIHYEMVKRLSEEQLQNIQLVATANQVSLMGDEITGQVSQILTQDDPLGLKATKPGAEFEYLAKFGQPPAAGQSAEGQSNAGKPLSADDFRRPSSL